MKKTLTATEVYNRKQVQVVKLRKAAELLAEVTKEDNLIRAALGGGSR